MKAPRCLPIDGSLPGYAAFMNRMFPDVPVHTGHKAASGATQVALIDAAQAKRNRRRLRAGGSGS